MVDLGKFSGDGDDDSSGGGGGGKKKKKKSKKKSRSGGGSSSGNAETYDPEIDERVELEGDESVSMKSESKSLAEMGGDYNAGAKSGESVSRYKKRQKRELRSFYSSYADDVAQSANNLADNEPNIEVFTLAFQAATYNLAQYRLGVAEALQEEFGTDKHEAVHQASEVCQEAGEEQMVLDLIDLLTEKFME